MKEYVVPQTENIPLFSVASGNSGYILLHFDGLQRPVANQEGCQGGWEGGCAA